MALALSGTEPLTYSLPLDLAGRAVTGIRAEVPVGPRLMVGLITGFREKTHRLCRPLASLLDDEPVLDEHMLWLTRWVAGRYLCSWGQAVWAALPPGMNRRQVRTVELLRDPTGDGTVDAVEARVIALLRGRGSVAFPWLMERSGEGSTAAVERLERRGLVASGTEWRGGRSRARTQRFLVKASEGGGRRLSPARARLWEMVSGRGEIPSAEALPASAAAWLVAEGLARWERREVSRLPDASPLDPGPEVQRLTGEQQSAFDAVARGMERGGHGVSLLFGVTASGKTEIYSRAARLALEQGRQALVLVPEIGLVSQMASRMSRHFPGLGVWHSELSEGERYDVWRACREGRMPMVIGVRSAVFAPLGKLGLVVVDEEHDASYKQQEGEPLYHAREVAIARAKKLGVQMVLGSATPSVESYQRARDGVYRMHLLENRIGGAEAPRVELVDCRSGVSPDTTLSPALAAALKERTSSEEQAMLLLNRRGFARGVQCLRCGAFLRCHNCDISLTYHRAGDQVMCHYCGYRRAMPPACPSCGSDILRAKGGGIQRLELELAELLPGVGHLRMDSDTTARKGSHARILASFQRGEVRVLIGTQMIAKGHHFPGVTLVGILDIDGMLGLPDFRGAERAAQLLVQMSGRAGRGERPGLVMVQTRLPGAKALKAIDLSRYREMLEAELEQREQAGYPPYKYIALITVSSGRYEEAAKLAEETAERLRQNHREVEVLGPAPAPIPKLRGRHRFQILLKHDEMEPLLAAGGSVGRGGRGATVKVDVDPVTTL